MIFLSQRIRSALTLAAASMIAGCESHAGCVIGPCGPPGQFPVNVVVGFPTQRVVNGEAQLSVGDTLVLYTVSVAAPETPCTARDTVHTAVQWASSDTNVATISVGPRGEGRIRIKRAGNFGVVMYTPFTGTIPANALVNPITVCPSGDRAVSTIRVAS